MILSPERTSFDRVTDLVWIGSRIASLDDFRRLRVLLRYGRSDDSDGAPASQA